MSRTCESHDLALRLDADGGAGSDPNNARPATAFSITFTYPDRFKAQAVVTQLVNKFMMENQRAQGSDARVSTSFLDEQLRQAKEKLDQLDKQIQDFQIANQGKLPEEFTSNTTMLYNLQLSNGGLGSDLQRATDVRTTLETNLKNEMAQLNYLQESAEDLVPGSAHMAVQNQNLINIDGQLMAAKQRLSGLKKSLGEKNPQITDLKGQIEVLQQSKEELEKEQDQVNSSVKPDAPKKTVNKQTQSFILQVQNQIESTKTQIAEAVEDIKRIQAAQAQVAQKIAAYEQRIQAAPLNGRQWAELQRDHALAQAAYNEFVMKKESAQTSQNLEDRQAGEQLEILDAASDPQAPIQPKRVQWAAIGTGLGLLLGVVMAGAKEVKNTSLKNLKDVRAYTNLPVLSSIPLLENALLVRRKRRLFWLAWTASFVVGSMMILASMYYYYFVQK